MAQAPAGKNPGKNLRVALIQGAKITEDRTLRKRVPVSVGQSATNTFVVPVSNLPSSFTLFELVENRYSLVFRAGMEGRVSLNGADLTLDQARAQGLAKARKDTFVLPLNDAAKGRVALGEVSLLFQFVTPPPEPPRAELPKDIRGGFFSQVDQFFFTILAASMFLHFSGVAFIASQPMPVEREVSLDELPDRFIKQMMPEAKPPPPKRDELADQGPKKDEKKDEAKETAKVEGNKPPAGSPEAKKALADKVARSGLLKVIGSSGDGAGSFEDVLGNSSGAGDVAAALSGASGVSAATADALGGNGPKGGAQGSTATIGNLGTTGGGNVALAEKGNATIKANMQIQAPEVESADVNREQLASYVRTRKTAIQQCYERELKRTPTLKGKVVVRFNIGTNGRASDVEIEENTLGNESVAACIRSVIKSWVFPFKPASEVPVAYPFVFSPAS